MFKPYQALIVYFVSLILPSCLWCYSGAANNMTEIFIKNLTLVIYDLILASFLASTIKLDHTATRERLIYSRGWYAFYAVTATILTLFAIIGFVNSTEAVIQLEEARLYDLEGYTHFGQMMFAWFTGCFFGLVLLSTLIWWLMSKRLQSNR